MMLSTHLPALQIVVPLMAAPICVILRNSSLAWILTVVANLVCLLIAGNLLWQVQDGSAIHYALGNWPAPTGIEYYIDVVNALILTLVSLISLIVAIYAKRTVEKEIAEERQYLFYTGWLLCLTGLLGITITGDAFNVFVFLEVSSLSTYFLIALGQTRPQAFLAAFRYLIMGSIGASFLLLGIGFLYAATGTLNMVDLAERIPQAEQTRTVIVAFSFIAIGLLIKAAVFPLHAWLANAYQFAPSAVSAFLAGTATKVSLYVLIRFFFHIFGTDFSFGQLVLSKLLLPAAIVGFILMSIVAIFQTDLRRLLAYSSVAQIGYIVAGLCLLSQSGIKAGMIHIINHGLIKASLFMAVGCIAYRIGSTHLTSIGRIVRQMPFSVGALVVGGLSLIGIPLTAGFISKWTLIQAALEQGWWPMAALILFSSLMAVIYIGKIIDVTCFSGGAAKPDLREAPFSMVAMTWLLVAFSVYLGIHADPLVTLADTAATALLEDMQP